MRIAERTPQQAYAALADYHVVDVREEHELDGPLGFIEGADDVPLSLIAERAEALRASQPLLVVCRSGRRSQSACEQLAELGVADVTNLAEGMIGWNRAGLAVVHNEPKSLSELVDRIVSWAAQVGPLTENAVRGIARERFARMGSESPTHAAVEELIDFVGGSLEAIAPPDLELSLAAFRRFLAVL